MKILPLLIAFCLWQSSANVIFRHFFDIGSDRSVDLYNPPSKHFGTKGTAGQILPRDDDETVCRPPSRPVPEAKRGINESPSTVHNQTLWRRTMPVPDPGDEDAYIVKQTESKDTYPIWWGVDNPAEAGRKRTQYDVNTALFRKYGDVPISLSTFDLHGCSCLAIVSRKGVYMSHYWESIAYSPDKKQMKAEGTNQPDLFEKFVLSGLRDGIKGAKITEQASLRDNAQLFDDDHTYAYLIHPAPKAGNRNGYQVEAQKIRTVVEDLVPKIKNSGRFILHPYAVQSKKSIRMKTSAGRALFLYDPREADPPQRGYTTAKIMLWSETRVIHQDQWDYSRRG